MEASDRTYLRGYVDGIERALGSASEAIDTALAEVEGSGRDLENETVTKARVAQLLRNMSAGNKNLIRFAKALIADSESRGESDA